MREHSVVPTAATGLRARPAAYSVIDRCLREQEQMVPRTWLAAQLGLSPLGAAARSWYAGALGELEVAHLLQALGDEWTVLHSLPIGPRGADVAHLVIGPSGVYTVTTKAVRAGVWVGRNRILIGGRRVDYIASAEREARRVHAELTRATGSSVFVHPLLVFVRPSRMAFREAPASVTVLTSDRLVNWLVDQERIYPPTRVAEIVAAADSESTWQGRAGDVASLRRQVQRFERLRLDVDEASYRARMTRVALVLAIGAVAIAAILLGPPVALDLLLP